MKKCTLLVLLLCTVLPNLVYGQSNELVSELQQLSENIQSVEAKKYSYGQSFTWEEERPYQIRYESSRTSEKGKTVTLDQYFNLKYIDPKSIRRDNVKDLLVVRALIAGKDKFIKNIKDGDLDKYGNEIEIIANDVDNARAIEELLEKAIPLAQKIPSEHPIPTDFDAQMKWLTTTISDVETDGETIEQKIQREENQMTRFVFESVSKGKKGTDEEQWAFNLIDLSAKKINLKVDKTKLYVNIETDSKKNYIRYHKNTNLQSYQKGLRIYVDNIEKGKAVAEAFSTLAEESGKRFSNKSATVADLSTLIKDVSIGEESFKQTMTLEDCRFQLSSSYTKKDESITDEDKVNLADLDPRSVKIDVSKKEIFVTAQVSKKQKLAQTIRNGEPSSFDNEFKIRATSIENARALLVSFPEAIESCKGKNECIPPNGSAASIMNAISKQIGDITIKSNVYQQSLTPVDGTPGQWEYTRIEDKGKKVKQETFIFNISDLNEKDIDFKVGKQAIEITFATNGKEEIIKYLVDDKADDYKKEMEWLVSDVDMMREVICGMEKAIGEDSVKN